MRMAKSSARKVPYNFMTTADSSNFYPRVRVLADHPFGTVGYFNVVTHDPRSHGRLFRATSI